MMEMIIDNYLKQQIVNSTNHHSSGPSPCLKVKENHMGSKFKTITETMVCSWLGAQTNPAVHEQPQKAQLESEISENKSDPS
jgi:hypothetical protein